MVPRRLLAVALAAALATAAGSQPTPEFGVGTDVVMIDLIALDGDGRPVTDLRAEELQVSEDGKKQRVEFVRFVGTAAPDASRVAAGGAVPASPAPADAAADASGPAPLAFGLNLVVVVDLLTMPADAFAVTRDAIIAMVRSELGPGTRLMLVTLDRGMNVRQSFTSDVARFVAAAEAVPVPAGEGEAALAELIDKLETTCDGTPGAVQSAIALGRVYVENTRLGLTNSTEGLAALARYLSALPGRKHVVYYTAGYPMDASGLAAGIVESICGRAPQQGTASLGSATAEIQSSLRTGAKIDAAALIQQLLDEANRAQTSIYTVDARGLMGDALSARAPVGQRLARQGGAQQAQQRFVREPQEMLYSIADGTGATASINTNELARGMRAAVADARGYYLLAYAPPPGRKEGRFYPIEVKTTRPGLRLRYRRGYEWLSDARRAERGLAAALRFPALYREGGLSLDAWNENKRFNVAAVFPTRGLEFAREGAVYRNEIAILGLLRDAEGRMVGKGYLFSKNVSMKLPEARLADLMGKENLEIASDAAQPARGHYQLTVAMRHSGGSLATAVMEFDVP